MDVFRRKQNGSPCRHVTYQSLPRRPSQFWAVLVSPPDIPRQIRVSLRATEKVSLSSLAPCQPIQHLPTQLRMVWLGHTMVSPLSVGFVLWLPSEPERKWPSSLGVVVVDVGHQASGRAARAPTSPTPAGLPHADRVRLPGTDLRAHRFASYSGSVPCRRQTLGLTGAHMLDFKRHQRALLRGVPCPCTWKRNGGAGRTNSIEMDNDEARKQTAGKRPSIKVLLSGSAEPKGWRFEVRQPCALCSSTRKARTWINTPHCHSVTLDWLQARPTRQYRPTVDWRANDWRHRQLIRAASRARVCWGGKGAGITVIHKQMWILIWCS